MLAALSFASVLAAAGPAGAQAVTPAAAEALAAPPGCAAVLTDPCLRTMLGQLGLAPKPLTHGYLIVVPHGTWTINVQALVSENGRKLGLNSNLGLVTESEVSGVQWKALLAANADLDPSYFYYNPSQTKLYMHRSFDTRQVTPAGLLRELTSFADGVASSGDLWKFTH